MPPVRRARSPASVTSKTPYETPIQKFLVGEEEAVFTINEGLIPKEFFKQHPEPCRKANKTPVPPHQLPTEGEDPLFVETDNMSEHTVESENGAETPNRPFAIDLTDDDVDYILKDRFYYSRKSFYNFIRHLHDAALEVPTTQQGYKALFGTYALAQAYEMEELQNNVINTLQKFYQHRTIPISDLQYVMEHWNNSVDCSLTSYLIAQVAYEWASDWVEYRRENPGLVDLFFSGHGVILEQLTQALASYAKTENMPDPAKQTRDWRLGGR